MPDSYLIRESRIGFMQTARRGQARHAVPLREFSRRRPMNGQKWRNFGVFELEAEFFDAGLNQWNVSLQIAVDEDVALRSGDEIVREAFAADVVEIAGDVKWRERLGPFWGGLGEGSGRSVQGDDDGAKEESDDSAHWRSINGNDRNEANEAKSSMKFDTV